MISVVVGREKRFTKDGLSLSMSEGRQKVGLRIGDERLHGLQVAAELSEARLPGGIARRGFGRGPIPLRPSGRNVLRIPREFQDVPERNAKVFNELPGSM